jgi:serine/threonine-protein kinase
LSFRVKDDADTLDAQLPQGRDPVEPGSRWVVADRYEVLGLLGSGGMGTVYRARDRELDELVALKMLRRGLASSTKALERFRREVKLARRVTHRNVARTFDIGEHAGARFLTMELVEGEMLGARLARTGRMRNVDVVPIARELASGLAAAHDAGVVHRDLKPENIIVANDGRVVITDFGIARALWSSNQSVGGVVGTPTYMAPEQVEGALDLDPRADVYAFGAIIFELMTGMPAWDAKTPVQIMMARLTEPPPDPRRHVPTLTESSSAFIMKCMARKRDDRFANGRDLRTALDQLISSREAALSAPPPAPSSPKVARDVVRTTVAVLPIVNEGAPEDDYVAATVHEELVDVLSAMPDVRVRAREDTATPRDAAASPQEAGAALGVQSVVDGRLRVHGGKMASVTLRLLTVEDGFQLWAQRFERPVGEIGAIVDEAADAIAHALTTKWSGVHRPIPADPVAHDLYLRGRYAFLHGWFGADKDAVPLLAEAHARAPHDATIAAMYARALGRAFGIDSLGEDMARKAVSIADQALALDPGRADARVAIALVHFYRGEAASAAMDVRRALELSPNDAGARDLLGLLRSEVGPVDRAMEHLGVAVSREPGLSNAQHTMARLWGLLGDWDKAMERLGPVPKQLSGLVPYLLTRARLALWRGQRMEAKEFDAIAAEAHLGADMERRVLQIIAGVVRRSELSADDAEFLDLALTSTYAVAQRRACIHAQLRTELYLTAGQRDRALATLREADENALIDVTWLEMCPLFEPVRTDPTFLAIQKSVERRAWRVRAVLE